MVPNIEFSPFHRLGMENGIFLEFALKGRERAAEPNGARTKCWRRSEGKLHTWD